MVLQIGWFQAVMELARVKELRKDKGFYHFERGYWQAIGDKATVADYQEGTIEVPLKPSSNHQWLNSEWVYVPQSEPTLEELRVQMPALTPC